MHNDIIKRNLPLSAAVTAAKGTGDATAVSDCLGGLDREEWRSLVSDWKAAYKALSAEIRGHRRLSKAGDRKSLHQMLRQSARRDARLMMLVRRAMKERSRLHWAARGPVAA